uniref:Ribosomal protein L16 n=1 Tax=Leachiella pacifica TaxID=282357 RepID=A0A3S8UVS8_9FLOR|nr:ribosomal protein L16 [Leachiella pacifica]
MLSPKKVKFKKQHRKKIRGYSTKGTNIKFGKYALQAISSTWLTSAQIESTRKTIVKYIKKDGKLWIRIFPDKPITKKSAETRMGSGKGSLEYWGAEIKRGRIIFEIGNISLNIAKYAIKLASYKLPVKSKFISLNSDIKYNI